MKRRTKPLAVLVLAIAVGGCADGTQPDPSTHGLSVEARSGLLVLGNTGPRTVRYVAMVSGALVLVTDPREWPTLVPGATTEIRNEDLVGYTPQATRATVLWAVGDRIGDPPLEVELH